MDPITAGLALANLVPSLMKFFNIGEKSTAVATEIVEIANKITGKGNAEESIAALHADPTALFAFRVAVMENDTQLEVMYLTDVANARARDIALAQVGQVNNRANALVFFSGALILILLAVCVWISPLDEYVKGIVTLIIGRASGWLDQAFNFDFGTTRNNRTKDETINAMSRK